MIRVDGTHALQRQHLYLNALYKKKIIINILTFCMYCTKKCFVQIYTELIYDHRISYIRITKWVVVTLVVKIILYPDNVYVIVG